MSTSRDGANFERLGVSSQPAVRFDAVSLRRDNGGAVLRGVSFALPPGSFHVLQGGPRTGKTSLLRLICLAESPSQGTAQVLGRDVQTLNRRERVDMRRRIGAALEPAVFIEHLSVWENAALGPRLGGRKPANYRQEVDEVLGWLGLAKRARDLPSDLAPAERSRLNLARAVADAPEILLVDEPPGGHSAGDATWLIRRLDEFHRTGAAVLLVASDPTLAAGHHVLRLEDGRISVADPDPAG
ncbi:MAG TPA: ATP-binding cassette domain-containing protein [Caulobacteraceae bacterium]|nr:ATP-binding cassette domain-containing protein [Caulobacteraceae bacterium]